MKRIFIAAAASLLTPFIVFAGTLVEPTDTFVGILAPKLSLLSAIIVAAVTSFMVFMNARSMRGGIFGIALNYFAIGMVLILGGFIVVSLDIFNSGGFTEVANNVLFILGYITMAIAAHKISQIAKGQQGE